VLEPALRPTLANLIAHLGTNNNIINIADVQQGDDDDGDGDDDGGGDGGMGMGMVVVEDEEH
jgi:hypothetical protein